MHSRDQFVREGWVIVRDAIDADLIRRLREHFEHLYTLRDRGETDHYTRQQALLSPKTFHRCLIDYLNVAKLNEAAAEVLGTRDLACGGVSAFLGSDGHTACRWHRDFQEPHFVMADMIQDPQMFAFSNCALYPDRSLWIVPGSHVRNNRGDEAAHAARYEALGVEGLVAPFDVYAAVDPNMCAGMPGAMNVVLEAGDCVIYNSMMWHASESRPEWKRATLHRDWTKTRAVREHAAMRVGADVNAWMFSDASHMGTDLGEYFGPQRSRYKAATS